MCDWTCMLAMHQFVVDDRWFQATRLAIAQNQVNINEWGVYRCRCVLASIKWISCIYNPYAHTHHEREREYPSLNGRYARTDCSIAQCNEK